jgi:hypothetical protein
VAGVALHDRAYGPLDNLPILETPELEWLALARRGFALDWDDPIAGAIAKHHIQRLTGYSHAPFRQSAAHEMAAGSAAYLALHGLDPQTFAHIDRITRLCDDIAFAFCFEAPTEGTVKVLAAFDRAKEIEVHYTVAGGTITADPWPFSVQEHQGYLLGYKLPAYPAALDPVLLFYTLRPPS